MGVLGTLKATPNEESEAEIVYSPTPLHICKEHARNRVEGEKHNSIMGWSIVVSKSCDRNGMFGSAYGEKLEIGPLKHVYNNVG